MSYHKNSLVTSRPRRRTRSQLGTVIWPDFRQSNTLRILVPRTGLNFDDLQIQKSQFLAIWHAMISPPVELVIAWLTKTPIRLDPPTGSTISASRKKRYTDMSTNWNLKFNRRPWKAKLNRRRSCQIFRCRGQGIRKRFLPGCLICSWEEVIFFYFWKKYVCEKVLYFTRVFERRVNWQIGKLFLKGLECLLKTGDIPYVDVNIWNIFNLKKKEVSTLEAKCVGTWRFLEFPVPSQPRFWTRHARDHWSGDNEWPAFFPVPAIELHRRVELFAMWLMVRSA